MARGKVITTHLRTGDPNGIRTVFISNKICEMIVFPKSEFEMVSKMEESSRPALYILLGEDENGSAQAYIGESTNGVKRIYNHKSHKLTRASTRLTCNIWSARPLTWLRIAHSMV